MPRSNRDSTAGDSGFGYDPLFVVPEYGKTFAELGMDIKNKNLATVRKPSNCLLASGKMDS